MLPKAVFTAVAAAGLACLLAGAVLLTMLAPSREVGGVVTVDGVLVTDPGVAALTGQTLVVEVTGSGGPVFAASARQVDAEAWAASLPATRVAGLTEEAVPDVRTVPGDGTVAVPDPRDSDVWTDLADGSAPLTFAVASPGPDSALVVVADAATVDLRWVRDATHPVAWPLVAGGAVLLIWGVTGLVRRNRHDRIRRRAAARAGRTVRGGPTSPPPRPSGPRRRSVVGPALRPVVATVMASVALTACAGVPEPDPAAAGSPGPAGPVTTGPAVTVGQAGRVLAALGAGLAAGEEDRLTGPAAAWRAGAGAGVPAQPTDGAVAVGAFGAALLEAGDGVRRWPLLVPRTDAWPRSFAVRAPAPGGGSLVAVLVATDARQPYRLWAALPVLDDAVLDAVQLAWPSPAEGAATIAAAGAADAGAGAAAPEGPGVAEVTATLTPHFADVLAEGDASVHAPEFAEDPVSTGVRERLAVLAESTRPARVESAHVPGPGAVPALAVLDADGGGLVVTAVTTTVRATARDGGPGVPVPEGYASSAGTVSAPRSLEITSTAALLFAVPAERGNIGPLAAADGITSVTAS